MATEVLGKNLTFKVTDPDTSTLTEVEGISSFTFNKDYTDTDTTTNDEDGAAASLPTVIGRNIDIEYKRLENTDGTLAAGQQVLADLSDNLGNTAVVECTLSTPNITLTFDGWVELDTPLDSTHEDHVTGTGTIHVNGSVTKS